VYLLIYRYLYIEIQSVVYLLIYRYLYIEIQSVDVAVAVALFINRSKQYYVST